MQSGVRKITNGRYKKIIGLFAGLKMEQVWWESPVERDYIYLLEADPDVLKYYGQPLQVKYYIDGEEHIYTPDFLVIRTNSRQIIEVKPEDKANCEENSKLFEQVAKVCKRNGYEFIVVTDKMIRIEPKLRNIKLLYKYARTGLTKQEERICCQYFSEHGSVKLGKAFSELIEKGISKNQLFAMIFRGHLEVNLLEELSDNSLLKYKFVEGCQNA